MPPDFNIRADLYELPHLFGFWLEDPELLDRARRATGQRHRPSVILFFGSWLEVHLSLQELEDDRGEPGLVEAYLKYRLGREGEEDLFFAREIVESPEGGGKLAGREMSWGWGILESGQLSFDDDNSVWLYNPTTTEAIVAAGYSRTLIEGIVDESKKAGFKFVETFNEETAKELQAESWSKFEKDLREPF